MGDINSVRVDDLNHVPTGTWGNGGFTWASVEIPAGTGTDKTVDFVELPRGARVIDSVTQIDGGSTAAADMRLGLASTNADAPAAEKIDDDDYFHGDKDLDATGIVRRENTAALGFPELKDPHRVRGTIKANAVDAKTTVYVGIWYVYEGTE